MQKNEPMFVVLVLRIQSTTTCSVMLYANSVKYKNSSNILSNIINIEGERERERERQMERERERERVSQTQREIVIVIFT